MRRMLMAMAVYTVVWGSFIKRLMTVVWGS